MTILQGGKQETGRTAPASGKRRALLLVKGNRPTKLVRRRVKPLTMGQQLILARDEYFANLGVFFPQRRAV